MQDDLFALLKKKKKKKRKEKKVQFAYQYWRRISSLLGLFFLFSCIYFFFFFLLFVSSIFQQEAWSSPIHYAPATGGLHAPHQRVAQELKASLQQQWPTTRRDDSYSRRVVVWARERLSYFSANSGGFSNWSWQFWNPHEILRNMKPSFVFEKIGSFSRANGILNLDPSQMGPYFEVMIPNLYSWRKLLWSYIYIYIWFRLQKITFFKKNYGNCQFKFTSFCIQG